VTQIPPPKTRQDFVKGDVSSSDMSIVVLVVSAGIMIEDQYPSYRLSGLLDCRYFSVDHFSSC
jgi:hypothetical protein